MANHVGREILPTTGRDLGRSRPVQPAGSMSIHGFQMGADCRAKDMCHWTMLHASQPSMQGAHGELLGRVTGCRGRCMQIEISGRLQQRQ